MFAFQQKKKYRTTIETDYIGSSGILVQFQYDAMFIGFQSDIQYHLQSQQIW